MSIEVGQTVTYKDHDSDARGRVIAFEGVDMGVRVWLVDWERAGQQPQRLKTPESSIRPL
ncbi:MAG TPA: hypothetical protein VNS09_02350 [Solirubrobacter sp.]|nr:hypothetical protein [Solirubrobacter sp.]